MSFRTFPIKRLDLYITSSHLLNPGYLRNCAACIGFVQRGRSLLHPPISQEEFVLKSFKCLLIGLDHDQQRLIRRTTSLKIGSLAK